LIAKLGSIPDLLVGGGREGVSVHFSKQCAKRAAATAAAAATGAIPFKNGRQVCFERLIRLFMGGGASTSSGKYVGQKLHGSIRHGRGSCALADGSYYEGDW